MNIIWDERHGKILLYIIEKFSENKIKYFILRNYESLPQANSSKDVDIIVEPGKIKIAKKILLESYKINGLENYYETVYGRGHCLLGMNINAQMSIHIDLIEGYLSKGYEIFTFSELYEHTIEYNGMVVMDKFFEGFMIYIYKQFGYTMPKLKEEYKKNIYQTYKEFPDDFKRQLAEITDKDFANIICDKIYNKDFDGILKLSSKLTKKIRKYVWRKKPIRTLIYSSQFVLQKFNRIIINYKKYSKTFAVMAPDGTGKTTFLDALIDKLNYYYVNNMEDGRFHVYHFRPSILPNLGAVGEKAGVMKQDTNFTDPHRNKPANPLSSLIRIMYYTLDYIIGWQKCVRNDVHYDRYTIFDRYSYDFIVDPLRTKLNLPKSVRKFFVKLTPQPQIVFFLNASPEVVYSRKQELTLSEIERQGDEYLSLANSNTKKFKIINAENTPDQMSDEALHIIISLFTEKL